MKAITGKQEFRSNYPSVNGRTPIWRVWREMKKRGLHHMLVREENVVLGVVRDKDLSFVANLSGGEAFEVREVMNPLFYCVDVSEPLEDVAQSLSLNDSDYVVIMDTQHQLVMDILSINQVLGAVLEQGFLKSFPLV